MRAIMRGLTDAEFERLYGTEEQCLAAWVKVRQDAGMPCPRCGNPRSYVYDRRVGCTRCDKRWSITSGTVMADTRLPLTTWFRAMHLLSSIKQGISAVELGRRLGVSYPTAWYLHKRLCHAMTEEGERCQLGAPVEGGCAPIVEADDVSLGGERNEGRGTAGKTRVIAAAGRHPSGRMGAVAMAMVSGFTNAEASAFRDAHIAPGALVHTDGTPGFPRFRRGRTYPRRHRHRRSASGARAWRPILHRQHADLQSQHRAKGNLQGVCAEASARRPRSLLLNDQSPVHHARYDRRPMPRRRNRLPTHPPFRLRVDYRADWSISGNRERTAVPLAKSRISA
jgi:transposase-like protein